MGNHPAGEVMVARRAREDRYFFSGTADHPIYVDCITSAVRGAAKAPVIMVHGAGHTGACYLGTPDGRRGWADCFAAEGRDVYVPDWPGHGRSPMRPGFATLSTTEIVESILVLLERVGPAVLLVHSASGPMAWSMAERRPDLVLAIIGIAPGPPANLLPEFPADPAAIRALADDESLGCPVYVDEGSPVRFDEEFIARYWANAPRFPKHAIESYRSSVVQESARHLNERFNIGGRGLRISNSDNLKECDILIVTGDCDPRHPRAVDARTAEYLGAEFVWLPDRGIRGNGHMLMLEDNSDALAALMLEWLDRKSH